MKMVKKKSHSNRLLYTLIILVILILVAGGIYAYGTSTPATFGHSAGELDFSSGLKTTSYIHASVAGGNVNLDSSTYELSGTNIAGQTVYAYGGMCVGNTKGDCSGTGGTVITSSKITSSQYCIGTSCITAWPTGGGSSLTKGIALYRYAVGCKNSFGITTDSTCKSTSCLLYGSTYYYDCNYGYCGQPGSQTCSNTVVGYLVN